MKDKNKRKGIFDDILKDQKKREEEKKRRRRRNMDFVTLIDDWK